jgi:hypothetical protein
MVADSWTGVVAVCPCVVAVVRFLVRISFERGVSELSCGRIGSFAAAIASSTIPWSGER